MEQFIITHIDGSTISLRQRSTVINVTRATQSVELLGNDVVDISVESAVKLYFQIGDKITIIGRDYTLNIPPKETKLSENKFRYDLQFEGVQYDLSRATYDVNIDTTGSDLYADALTGNMKLFLDVLIANINRVFPGKWVLGTYPDDTETKTLTFSETDNCLAVLQRLCEEYNQEFDIAIAQNGTRTINIGQAGKTIAFTFQYGKGKGIYELTREKVSSSNIVNRLKVYGGSKNISAKYRATRLCLPGKNKAQSYIENAESIAKYGIWENAIYFEDIFPQRTGVVTALGDTILKFVDNTMDFDLNEKEADGVTTKYLLAGTPAKVHFNTGNLAGYEFEITSYDHATKMFTIRAFKDERDMEFPSETSAAFRFAVGDEYVLLDIAMPQSYIDAAEQKLLEKGQEYLSQNCQPKVQYSLKLVEFFLKKTFGTDVETNIFWVGDYIPIKDDDLEVDKLIRVKGFTRDLLKECSYNLTISDLAVTRSIYNRIISDLIDIDKIIQINDLANVAKARRNWLNAQEVLGMVFDVEGDYYTDKIKPQSIETMMLSVGAKSMQFVLVGTVFQPNYGANKNRVVYKGGTLTHYAIVDENNNPRYWVLQDGDVTVTNDFQAYYIYAKCEKNGTGGIILFSDQQIQAEQDTNYYHFLIGVLNSVDAELHVRSISLMYGFTTINGKFIRTGRIDSIDGKTYFDLDNSVIGGRIKFISTSEIEEDLGQWVEGTENSISQAQTDANAANNKLADIANDNKLTPSDKQVTKKEWDIIVAEKPTIEAQATTYGITTEKTNYVSAYNTLNTYITPLLADLTTTSDIVGTTFRANFKDYYDKKAILLKKITDTSKTLSDAAQTTASKALSKANISKAITDKFGTTTDGGLINTVITEFREADSEQVTGLISGIQGTNKDLPFLVAGGTYAEGIAGTAKAIIRHDGSVKFTDAEITGVIHATSGEFTGTVYATDGEFNGKITATSGVVGGFSIGPSSLVATNYDGEMLLSSNLIRFTGQYSEIAFGNNVLPMATNGDAINTPITITVNRPTPDQYVPYGNIGLWIDVTGVKQFDDAGMQYSGNNALYITRGTTVGFRPRVRRVSTSQTLSTLDTVIFCVAQSAKITLTLPTNAEDGQIYFIKKATSPDFVVQAGSGDVLMCGSATSNYTVPNKQMLILIYDKHNRMWMSANAHE